MQTSRKSNLLIDCPIWITGMGAVSAAGLSVDDLWSAASTGKCNRNWQNFSEKYRYLTAQVPDIKAVLSTQRELRKLDRSAQLAGIAVEEAMQQAGLETGSQRSGVIFGTSRGTLEKYMEAVNSVERGRMRPLLAATGTTASISGSIAYNWKLGGPSATVSTACASAAHAIGIAAEKILLGDADIMIAGGTDACLHPTALGSLAAANVIGSHDDDQLVCRPFDQDRNGLLPGEGAGCLILESAESAINRGVKPLAILRGWAMGGDTGSRTGVTEDGSGLLKIMNSATELAGISADEIQYINAHGTGTRMNDLAEANAIASYQSDNKNAIPVSSTKPITGHCLGATPALEAIMTISALRKGVLPISMGCLSQDPKCQIDLITGETRRSSAEIGLSNSLGFWGHIATLLLESSQE